MKYEDYLKDCIFRFMSGSHAYGFNGPDSDEDYRGVFIAPLSKSFELFGTSFMGQGSISTQLKEALFNIDSGDFESAKERIRQSMDPCQGDLSISVGTVHKPGCDEELQELRKFMKLASECNPNIIEFLWVDRFISTETEEWKLIKKNRDLFLSKRARFTFSGYAISQLKRIKTHRGYLLNPREKKPLRSDFGLREDSSIPIDHRNAILSLPDGYLNEGTKDEVIREKKYRQALEEWKSYQKWLTERNERRKEIERKYGYDTKHACHLVRLIRMAKEIISDGNVLVYRPDREELAAIRNGAWSYDKLVGYAQEIDEELEELYNKSQLRERPDYKKISNLYVEICESRYGIKLH